MATYEHYALVIPPTWEQFVFEHSCVNVPDRLICTLGWGTNNGANPITDAMRQGVADAWIDNIVPDMNVNIVLERVYSSDAGGVVWEIFPAVAGQDNAAPATVNNAVLVEKRTGVSGRAHRGRFYAPLVDEGTVDQAGNITGAYKTALQADFDAMLADLNSIDVDGAPYILHSKGWNGAVEPADPGNAPAPTEITSFVVKTKIGTQRRRLR